jgi:hypothetical protein
MQGWPALVHRSQDSTYLTVINMNGNACAGRTVAPSSDGDGEGSTDWPDFLALFFLMASGVPPNDTERERRRFCIHSSFNCSVIEIQDLNLLTSWGSVSSILTCETSFRRMPGVAGMSGCVTCTSAGAGSSNGGAACLERNRGGKASTGNLLSALDVKGSIDPSEYT